MKITKTLEIVVDKKDASFCSKECPHFTKKILNGYCKVFHFPIDDMKRCTPCICFARLPTF